jgi:hypothetical protein
VPAFLVDNRLILNFFHMYVIDNTNLINMCRDCGLPGFLPKASYVFDAGARTVTVTDDSDIPADAALKKIKVKVHDYYGGTAVGEIAAAAGNVVVDVSDLDLSKQLAIAVTVILDNGGIADGGAYGIGAAGDIGHWDVQLNAANAM